MQPLPPSGPPNPEWRPLAAWLTNTWLDESAATEGPLEALREARALLSDPTSHLRELDALANAWPGTSENPLVAAVAAAVAGRHERLEPAGHFLRAVANAYALQASFFGLAHKLGSEPETTGAVPSSAQLNEVWPRVYQVPVLRFVGARVPDALLKMLRQRGPAERMGPETAPAMRASIAAGVPCLCAAGRNAWLAAAARGDGFVAFDVIAGTSGPAALDGLDEIHVAEGPLP